MAPDYHVVGGYLKQKSGNIYVIWCLMMVTELAFIDMLALSNVDVTVDTTSVALVPSSLISHFGNVS